MVCVTKSLVQSIYSYNQNFIAPSKLSENANVIRHSELTTINELALQKCDHNHI